MVAERLRVALDPAEEQPEPTMRWRRDQQPPVRREHTPDLRQPPGGVRDVLDHLAGPDHREGVVGERQRTAERNQAQFEVRICASRPRESRLGDVGADHRHTTPGELSRERTRPASEVEHVIFATHIREQEAHPERKVGRIELLGQPLPELFVVIPDPGTVPTLRIWHVSAHTDRVDRRDMSRRLLAITPVDHPGGAEKALFHLLAGLRDRHWTISLTSPGHGALRDWALSRGYEWHGLPLGGLGPRDGARAIASWPQARQLAASTDVVYLNGAVCGRIIPALAGIRARVVLHVHDIVSRVPRMWRRADVVLAASRAVARALPGLDARVVYCPIDQSPPEVAAPWPTGNGPVIGFVGRIEPRKGPLDLVRAAAAIRSGANGARIVVIGDDPYLSAPDYAAEVIGSSEIEHYPWSENAQALMRHMDVLVLPSYQEPFGTVLAEAMAVGTPVVATAVDGLPEVVTDGVTGRLITPGRPDELASAVLDVLAHRSAMSVAAREDAQRFDVQRHVELVESLILE
jgi:glycosyltransferase involved in cell wall biosynthesis